MSNKTKRNPFALFLKNFSTLDRNVFCHFKTVAIFVRIKSLAHKLGGLGFEKFRRLRVIYEGHCYPRQTVN